MSRHDNASHSTTHLEIGTDGDCHRLDSRPQPLRQLAIRVSNALTVGKPRGYESHRDGRGGDFERRREAWSAPAAWESPTGART
jgi:hypothetical protein